MSNYSDSLPISLETPAGNALNLPVINRTDAKDKQVSETEDMMKILDSVWMKIMALAKQLRDLMRLYNEKKQSLSFSLEMNALNKRMDAIESNFAATEWNALGNLTAGILQAAVPAGMYCYGAAAAVSPDVCLLGANITSNVFKSGAEAFGGTYTREAENARTVADLQSNGSQSYQRTLDEIVDKAREVMQQMMDLGRSLLDNIKQALQSIRLG